jgi:hypothetical protein
LDDENWESGVFGHGEFKYDIIFEIRAAGGLQTGLKHAENGNFYRNGMKIRTLGFSVMENSKMPMVFDLRNERFINRFKMEIFIGLR